jgi:phosphoribosylanthranilate isomerase
MWIKICGITNPGDAWAAAQAGASAIGLNFYPRSKRFVAPAAAADLMRGLRQLSDSSGTALPEIVGVFVNADMSDVIRTVEQVGLNTVQFHGEESPADIAGFQHRLPGCRVIRALRVSVECMADSMKSLDALVSEVALSACLLDAFVAGEYGGTGRTIDRRLPDLYFQQLRPPLIVAGGLTPENVAQIAEDSRIWGVDTASGVEVAPGQKDAGRMQSFVQAAQAASRTTRPS